MPSEETIKIVLVDDHKLFRKGMMELINRIPGYAVIWEANHGKDLIEQLALKEKPHIVLLDITMPVMDGYETADWLKQHHPAIQVLALSMYDTEPAIIKMLQSGAKGYILKDADPSELKAALQDVTTKGFSYSELVTNTLYKTLSKGKEEAPADTQPVPFNEREMEFLRLACTELTYKEIADKMCLAPRTIDGYRETLFEKLQVKNRVGLVLYAIKSGVVKL